MELKEEVGDKITALLKMRKSDMCEFQRNLVIIEIFDEKNNKTAGKRYCRIDVLSFHDKEIKLSNIKYKENFIHEFY